MSLRLFRIRKSARDICACVSALTLSETNALYVFCRVSLRFRPRSAREMSCMSFRVGLSFRPHPHPHQ
jgi:hypothetical protein